MTLAEEEKGELNLQGQGDRLGMHCPQQQKHALLLSVNISIPHRSHSGLFEEEEEEG